MAGGEVTDTPFFPPGGNTHTGFHLGDGGVTPDPIALILSKIDGRIDGRLDARIADINEYLQARDDAINDALTNIYVTLAEVVAGNELGMVDRWREFVVAEAQRLDVRPSEILGRGGNDRKPTEGETE